MRININKGFDFRLGTVPDHSIGTSKSAATCGLLGRDYQDVRLQVIADEGSAVKAGEAVLCDRRRPEILLTSPVSGTVTSVHRGARRKLISLEISSDDKGDSNQFDIPSTMDRASIRQLMLQSGLWATLRTRPFGHIPGPERDPKALLITAIDTQPLAPDPAVIVSEFDNEFSLGLKTLCNLTDAPVYLCKASDAEYQLDESSSVRAVSFSGAHPAGLVGRHIHDICPIGFDGNEVWHIDYQDVISLGRLISTGRPWYQRVISLAGSAVKNPRLISVPLGAAINDIIAGELGELSPLIISGSILSGHLATGHRTSLGQRHRQITAVVETSSSRSTIPHSPLFNAGSGDEANALIPITDLDGAAPPGILAVPLLRALLVGDVERARDLGALELVEEDLALLSYTCASKTDYGPLLRNMLEQIHKEGLSTRG
jgi:Na+-transporting NADH:ubiquinone oxidoreductase subunit A